MVIQSMENDVYSKVDDELRQMGFIQGRSVVLEPKRIEIAGMSDHALQRFEDRQATQAMARKTILTTRLP